MVDAKLLHKETAAQLKLSLTAYSGIVRLHVTEQQSLHQRFEVPGVLAHDLADRQASWDKTLRTAEALQLQLGDAEIRLQYSPLELNISIAGQTAVSFGSRRMFNFEHHREKKVRGWSWAPKGA